MELITRVVSIKHGNMIGKADKTFLHINDKNILMKVELIDSIVEFKDKMLLSYSIKKPNGDVVNSTEAFIKNNMPYILLREELFTEKGEYQVQLKLYDAHAQSHMSIAPFFFFVEETQGEFINDSDMEDVLLSQQDYALMTHNQLMLEMERAVRIVDLDETEELQGFTIVSDENGTYKYDVSKLTSDEELQEKIDEVKQYIDEKVGEDIDLSQYATYDYVDAQDATRARRVHSHVVADIEDLVIPTKVSQLQNDAGYITEIPSVYVTESELATELNNKANKSEFNELKSEVRQARNNATDLDTRLDAMERESSTHAKRDEIGNLVQNELDAVLPNLVENEVNGVMGDYVKVNQFNTSMASKANTSDLNATNQNVGILSVKVENINTSLENKASKAELNALATRVATNETDIDNLEQDVTVIETEIANMKNNMGEPNVQANWNETDITSDTYIKNKPNLSVFVTRAETGSLSTLNTVSKASLVSAINEVKAIAEQPTGEDNVQSDWLQTDTGADSYIKNKPVIPTSVEQLQGIDKYALETSLQDLVKEVVEARAMSPYVFANLKDRLDAMDGGGGNVNVDLSNYYTKEQTETKILEMLVNGQFLEYKFVDVLPIVGEASVIYLLKQNDSNVRLQYMYVDGAWENLGTTEVDLSNYYTKDETYSKVEMDATLGTVALTTTAQTVKGAINELDLVNDEVIQARTDYHNIIHGNLKARLDADRKEVVDARTDVDGNVHENLQKHIHSIETNIDEIEEYIGEEELATEAKIIVDAINEIHERISELNTGGNGCPVGSVLPFTGNGLLPNGFIHCRGQEVSREDYAELFEVIGTTYGAGDGATTFKLPDLQGRVPVGQAYDVTFGDGYGSTFFTRLGEKGGDVAEFIQLRHLPAHTHELQDKTHYHDGGDGTSSTNSYTDANWLTGDGSNYDSFYIPIKNSAWNSDSGDNVTGSDDYYVKSNSINFRSLSLAHKHFVKGATIKNWRTKHTVLNSNYEVQAQKPYISVQPYLTVDYIICYTKVCKFNSEIIEWLPQTEYAKGMMVYIGGEIFKSLADHTSSDDFSTDEDKWEVIVSGGDAVARELREEVTKARKDIDGVEYGSLGEHLDAIETNFDTVIGDMTTLLTDEKTTIVGSINELHTDLQEVIDARTDVNGNVFANLKTRLDSDKQEVIDARTDAKDFTYATLGQRLNEMDKNIEQNAKDIEEIEKQIGDITTLTTTNTDNLVGAINSMDAELDYARVDVDGVVHTTFGERINKLETDAKECIKIQEIIGDTDVALNTTEPTIIGAINELKELIDEEDENVQSDWDVTNPLADAYIKNKPIIPSRTSELTNDSDFTTIEQVEQAIETALEDVEVDLTDYYTKTEVDTKLDEKSDTSHTHAGMVTSPIVTRIELVQELPQVEEDGVLYLVIQN